MLKRGWFVKQSVAQTIRNLLQELDSTFIGRVSEKDFEKGLIHEVRFIARKSSRMSKTTFESTRANCIKKQSNWLNSVLFLAASAGAFNSFVLRSGLDPISLLMASAFEFVMQLFLPIQ
jgi:hypothetical protein